MPRPSVGEGSGADQPVSCFRAAVASRMEFKVVKVVAVEGSASNHDLGQM